MSGEDPVYLLYCSFNISHAIRPGAYSLARYEEQHYRFRIGEPEHEAWKNLRLVFGVLEFAGYMLEIEFPSELD